MFLDDEFRLGGLIEFVEFFFLFANELMIFLSSFEMRINFRKYFTHKKNKKNNAKETYFAKFVQTSVNNWIYCTITVS